MWNLYLLRPRYFRHNLLLKSIAFYSHSKFEGLKWIKKEKNRYILNNSKAPLNFVLEFTIEHEIFINAMWHIANVYVGYVFPKWHPLKYLRKLNNCSRKSPKRSPTQRGSTSKTEPFLLVLELFTAKNTLYFPAIVFHTKEMQIWTCNSRAVTSSETIFELRVVFALNQSLVSTPKSVMIVVWVSRWFL